MTNRIKRLRRAYPQETSGLSDRECVALLNEAKHEKNAIDKAIVKRAG